MSQVIEIAGYAFKLIGDPHLGRAFKTGVPTHRLGDREEGVLDQFVSEILSGNEPTIIMGDLFDKYSVDESLLISVADILNHAIGQKKVYILRGLMFSKDFALRWFLSKTFGKLSCQTM